MRPDLHAALEFPGTDGVFTTSMAGRAGVSRQSLGRAVARGDVRRVCGRAWMRADRGPTVERRVVASRLTWPDDVACFRTAALLHGFRSDDDGSTHVLVPDTRADVAGVVAHHWSVRPTAVAIRGAIRLTDRRTTLADCLGRLPEAEAWGLLAWLWTRDQIGEEDIAAQIDDRSHLYGVVRLRAMLGAVRTGALSLAEVAFQQFLRDHGFLGWRADAIIRVDGRVVARVDVLFLDARLVVEYDGAVAHHAGTAARDVAREARLRALGYRVLRVTWADLCERPGALLRALRAELAAAA